jgi:hypothetical protein
MSRLQCAIEVDPFRYQIHGNIIIIIIYHIQSLINNTTTVPNNTNILFYK